MADNLPGVRKQEPLDDYVTRCTDRCISAERATIYWNLDRLWWQAMKANDVDALRVVLVDVIEFQKQILELDP